MGSDDSFFHVMPSSCSCGVFSLMADADTDTCIGRQHYWALISPNPAFNGTVANHYCFVLQVPTSRKASANWCR